MDIFDFIPHNNLKIKLLYVYFFVLIIYLLAYLIQIAGYLTNNIDIIYSMFNLILIINLVLLILLITIFFVKTIDLNNDNELNDYLINNRDAFS